jgi:hypothetical protein
MAEQETNQPRRAKGCALLLALCGVVLVAGNLFPPIQLVGCAVTPSRLRGLVLDQDGHPVPEAFVTIKRHLTPFSDKGEKTVTMTDDEGRFSYFGLQGFSLFVSVDKQNFYSVHEPLPARSLSGSERSFDQFSGGFPDPRDPEVFHLFRPPPPEELIKHSDRNYRIPRNGTPILVQLNPTDIGPRPEIELRCWTNEPLQQSGTLRYDWHAEIRPKSGAGVRRKDRFDFIAPKEGYETAFEIKMPARSNNEENKEWKDDVEIDAFYRFEGGIHARAKVRFIAGGDHFVVFESVLNPKAGSRNLSVLPKWK